MKYTLANLAALGLCSFACSSAFAQSQSADADFAARCAAPGVVKCLAFDNDTTDIVRNVNLWPNAGGVFLGGLDRTTVASGGGSLRFDLPPPPNAGANISGSWAQQSGGVFGRVFGQNSTFYVQYRMRLSPEMVVPSFGNVNWKTTIFHYNNRTCGAIELTTSNYYGTPLAQLDTSCGARWMWTTLDGSAYTASPPLLMQQTTDLKCAYGAISSQNCAYFVANEWMTLYYRVQIGTWDQPNSSIDVWLARQNATSYTQFVKIRNFPLSCNSDSCTTAPGTQEGFNNVTFTPYMTSLGVNDGPSTTARMWFDEFIVSTQPITLPGNPVRAKAPTNVR